MIQRIINLYRQYFWNKVKYARNVGVDVGNNCEFYSSNFGSEPYLVKIGDHVQITHGVRFFTHGGAWTMREEYPDFDSFGKIVVGNNVYIGVNALIMPGVTIGNNVVIAAGSIVTKSIEDNVVVAGIPAKIVSRIDDYKNYIVKYNLNTKGMNSEQKKKYLLSLPDDKFIKK